MTPGYVFNSYADSGAAPSEDAAPRVSHIEQLPLLHATMSGGRIGNCKLVIVNGDGSRREVEINPYRLPE